MGFNGFEKRVKKVEIGKQKLPIFGRKRTVLFPFFYALAMRTWQQSMNLTV
jgi:hypothetical protein